MTNICITRRIALLGAAALTVAPSFAFEASDTLAEIEKKAGGRLGACILDTATGKQFGHRLHERFAMCSTFKMPLAAAILRAADQGKLNLDTIVPYTKADMLPHAPVTEANLDKGGMSIRALAKAAQEQSDNPAANLLLRQVGGPAGLTQFFRDIGDTTTRLDRFEPEMNRVAPSDERDTTTPSAMAATIAKLLTGDVLKPASRDLLIQWMIDTTTGTKRIRAGLPKEWRAGDKTGTGLDDISGKINDVAIVWPPTRAPIIITAYYNTPKPVASILDEDQAVLADVGRMAPQLAK